MHLAQQVHIMPSQDTRTKAARRRHDEAFKRELIRRSMQPGASVSAIALENGINANLLFNWRRLHLQDAASAAAGDSRGPVLLPVTVVEPPPALAPSPPAASTPAPAARPPAGSIEINIRGTVVRVRGTVDEASLRTVLRALAGIA